jgi:hypothetical protein
MHGKRLLKLAVLPVALVLLATIPALGSEIATADLELADPPWCYPGSCNLLAEDYPEASAQVSYHVTDTTFHGYLSASGMLPNTLYQIKLEGRPTCKYGADGDDASNMMIGSVGRWWDDTVGWNITDAEVDDAIAAGHCVLGYVIFDCATSDADGKLYHDLNLDYSWHVCGTPERGPVELPNGDYNVSFAVTENHQWWRTVLINNDISFTVNHWLDLVDIGSGDGYEDGNPYSMAYWSRAVCPTETGGSYGGIAGDPDSPDGECRLVWAHDYRPDLPLAGIHLWMGDSTPNELVIRALDGLADDSFDVYIRREYHGAWEMIYSYADQYSTETWLVHEIPLPAGDYPLDYLKVKIVATGPQWDHFETYGQLAVDWIGLWR